MLTAYLNKMRGFKKSPPRVPLHEVFFSWIGALIGIGAVSYINYNLLDGTDLVMIVGSFGASAVLIYGVTQSPLAQPRNLVGGHFVSALVGVTMQITMGDIRWLAGAIAVAMAIVVMQLTRTIHPPRRRNCVHCGHRKREDPQPRVPVCCDPRSHGSAHHAVGSPGGQQPVQREALPGILAVKTLIFSPKEQTAGTCQPFHLRARLRRKDGGQATFQTTAL